MPPREFLQSSIHPFVSLYHNRGRAVTEIAVYAQSLAPFGLEPFAGEGSGCHPRGGTPVMPGGESIRVHPLEYGNRGGGRHEAGNGDAGGRKAWGDIDN